MNTKLLTIEAIVTPANTKKKLTKKTLPPILNLIPFSLSPSNILKGV
jgi:hypothetical protein